MESPEGPLSASAPPAPADNKELGPEPAAASGWRRLTSRFHVATRWLLIALALSGLLNLTIVAGLVLRGESVKDAAVAVSPRLAPRLFGYVGVDSWHAMSRAYRDHQANPDGDLYRVLFEDGVKFQYPPSSLFVLLLVPEWLIDASHATLVEAEERTWRPFSRAGGLAVLLTVLLSIACYLKLTRVGASGSGPSSGAATSASDRRSSSRFNLDTITCVGAGLALGVTFYPLLKGQFLGQIQIYLGLLVALAMFSYVQGRRAMAGVCLGLCCLIKPQYAVLLLWGALRRERSFTLAMLAVGVVGLAASLAVFGLADHLRYIELLSMISRSGEPFWANQSVNGIMHRWLETASPLVFSRDFGVPHPAVRVATLLSTALILTSALWPPRAASGSRGTVLDLGLAVVAATIASPVAWEHHYGCFFAVFAVAAAAILEGSRKPRVGLAAALLCAYLLIANTIDRPELLFANRWTGLLGAHTFWGGVTLLAVLQVLVRQRRPE